jgi:chromosome segregation ATPase
VPDVTPIEENIKLIQQQLVDNDISQLSAKLATLGTTLVTMTESHKNLLELQSDVSELSKEIEAMKSVVKQAELVTEALSEYKDEYKGIKREIEDLWMGLDHLSDPLR